MTGSTPDLSRLRIDRDAPSAKAGNGRRTFILIAAIVIVGLAGLAYLASRPRSIEVKVASASVTGGESQVTGEGITANGYVVARTKASVSAKIAGRLEYLAVHEGSFVKKGAIMARIESPGYAAALAASRAEVHRIEVELAQAKRDLERSRSLRQQDVISSADLENASTRVDATAAQLESARAALDGAAVNLENTRVRAPFDGTVLRKDAEVGEIVAPASAGGGLTRTAIVTMADLATLEVEVDVNEAYIAQIRGDQTAAITLDAYPDTSFRGRVRQVVPTADRQKATVQVKVSILDRDPRILPEMGAKVVFLRTSDRPVASVPRRVLIPADAVVRASGGGTQVWVVENQKVTARAVEIGRTRGDHFEVDRGLTGGETVVLNPPATLKNGLRVRIASS